MANSVLDSLDGRDKINEVKMWISGYRTIGKFTVLVEGIDDVKVYEKFFLKEKVIVCPTNGCAKLVELVDGLNKIHLESNFIGIKDADYDVLNHVSYPYPNLFMTDKHDLETMMISEEALENIMKEFLRYEDMKKERIELNVQDFLQKAIEKIRSLSYFRWYNDLSRIKLSFGTLKLSTMLKVDSTLSYDCCLAFITRLNPDATFIPTSRMLADFENSHSGQIDTYQLLRGHDLCEMLSLLLQSHPYSYAKSHVSDDKIEASLRLVYSGEQFRKTQLYASITTWFESNGYHDMMAC